jgi:hypothetical protein
MGGGLMQLVAYGAQDIYLTGNPQITFFKVVYRRHTNFSMESIQQTWAGSVGFGNRVTATVSRNGDLVHKMYLQTEMLPSGSHAIACNIGTAIVNDVTLEIGGQQIDKHTGHWMETWMELTNSEPQVAAAVIATDTGHVGSSLTQRTTGACGLGGADIGTNDAPTFYVPLQFWFCRNPGLALPLIALQYHEVKVILNLAAQADCIAGAPTSFDTQLWCDYIYLDTDERRRFAQVSHEYLIEQLQYQDVGGTAVGSYDLNFNHPVKELIISGPGTASTPAAATGPSTPLALTSDANSRLTTLQLKLNGHDRFAARPLSYFTGQQIMDYHSGYGGRTPAAANYVHSIGVYSFALKPEEHQPSGTCNFSRIDNAQLVVGAQALAVQPIIFAVNYNVLRIMSGMGGLAYSN